ncbi:hypothetical protein Salat_1484800 [Sesamum alatum]|uniref:GRF-type domain-containing protein n=1 Tax=Sesamum alatum TaxID=300844 RepID=A0AAE2CMC2_9LAMI|nr:hypothetical protein Salat_1484800 [Sesamum alatum]
MAEDNVNWADGSTTRGSQGSSSFHRSDSYSFDGSLPRNCRCGQQVFVRTSWTNRNPGRRFRGCPGALGSYCDCFEWIDPPMCRRSTEIIPRLLRRLNNYESSLHKANVLANDLNASVRRCRRLLRLTTILFTCFIIFTAMYALRPCTK